MADQYINDFTRDSYYHLKKGNNVLRVVYIRFGHYLQPCSIEHFPLLTLPMTKFAFIFVWFIATGYSAQVWNQLLLHAESLLVLINQGQDIHQIGSITSLSR